VRPSPLQSRIASRAPEHVSNAGSIGRTGTATPLVLLVGNPNCGKSTLFNAITGGNRAVGNWAGVTVDSGMGSFEQSGRTIDLIDLPGVYSLAPSTVDEQVTRDAVAAGDATLLVNVLDASNLERNLYLTMQLAELGIPMLVVLNMGDTAAEAGITVDPAALSQQLACPVVEVCASRRTGIEALRAAIAAAAANPAIPGHATTFEPVVADAVDQLAAALPTDLVAPAPARWAATRLLEFDAAIEERCPASVLELRDELATSVELELGEEVDILVADARYERIAQLAEACVHRRGRIGASRTERIDRIALHPRWGIPVFLGVMYVMFLLTITFGSAFIDLFDQLGALLFVELPANVMYAIGLPEGLVVLLANGIGGGLQSVATFIPPVGIMFLCLRFLEESGYMARAAFVMDRFMRRLGLPGKAFVPMIVGFGCNVPAIMGARTLERERDRKLAVALNPFMSCGARLPVYALFAASFFPSSGQMVVFVLYLLGIAVAVMTGLILKGTVLKGELTPFVMELPPYHRPQLGSVLRGAWSRLRSFLVGAGKLIVPVVAALTLLGSMGTDGTFGHDNADDSVLSSIGRALTPAFEPMGIQQDNWQATVGIFTGIFAKEAVVGTLNALYSQADGGEAPPAEEPLDPAASIGAAFATVPANLVDATRSMVDPMGLSVGTVEDPQAAAAEQGVDERTYDAMVARFDGQAGAFAYLLFVLLYLPCVAATAAIYRETGRNWAIFVGCWTTGLAFMAATIFYQLARFSEHPASSAAWILGLLGVFALVVWRMRAWSQQEDIDAPPVRATPAPIVPAPVTATAPDSPVAQISDAPVPPPAAESHAANHGRPAGRTSPTASPALRLPRTPLPAWSTPTPRRRPDPVRPEPIRPTSSRSEPVHPGPLRVTPAQPATQPVSPAVRQVPPTAARLDRRPTPSFQRTRFLHVEDHGDRTL
jgi:ferrous iron transport protein B